MSDLSSFKQWLEVLKPYQAASAELMRPILAAHVAKLVSQDVVYAEIMLSPTMFPRERQAMIRGLQEWREWTLELEEGKIQVEYLMVIPRSFQMVILESDAAMFVELGRANLIVGIALVGIETGESIDRSMAAGA